MIKLLAICGSPVKDSNLLHLMREGLKEADREGVEYELFDMHGKKAQGCIHCNWCMAKQKAGSYCAVEDDLTGLYPKILEADGLLIGSPVYLGRLSGHLASLLDRTRCLHYGREYAGAMKHKAGAAMAVSWYRNSGLETTLSTIHWAFLTYQMVVAVPGSLSTFGGAGLTSLDGTGGFDPKDKHQIFQDAHGIDTARATVKSLIELTEIIKAGKAAAVTAA